MVDLQRKEAFADLARPTDFDRRRELVTFLTRVPTYWIIAVLIGVVLSCLTVTRGTDGRIGVRFAVTMTAVALLSAVWIPAVVRMLVVGLKTFSGFGIEMSLAGLEEFYKSHEPTHATLKPAGGQTLESGLPPVDLDFENVAESEYEEEEGKERGRDSSAPPAPGWTRERADIYRDNHDLFLVHSIKPSSRENQRYDVFVYLAGSHGVQPSDVVDQAEFFLGRFWGNRVFSVRNPDVGRTIGIKTSAYGAALCICRVTFKDARRSPVILHRFLDFEMGWVFAVATEDQAETSRD